MSGDEPTKFIVATEDARTLPAIEILTGRGFVTGKSGSGKSNSVSVIAEELLSAGYNLLIVDTEGEYFGLKEQYEILHVGKGEECDVQIDRERAGKIAEITLRHNVPVILNVSDFIDQDEAKAIVANVVERLFVLEGDIKKPFLLVVEEMQEYLPQSGGKDDLAKLLLRVAKRGRKRGLGICGISQRPSAVDKDFITQCDWMVWHRLTWENDVEIVRKILGSGVAGEIPELNDGEAYLLTDWDDDVSKVQFRRKKTFDAGATPGLEEYERPSLKSIGPDLIRELEGDDAIETDVLDFTVDSPVEADSEANLDDIVEASGRETNGQSQFDDDLQLLVENGATEMTDIAELDAHGLEERLKQERRRSEILEAEVRELKEIINSVHRSASTSEPNRHRSAESADRPGSSPSLIHQEPRREGVIGTLVELALLTTYLFYRVVDGIRRGVLSIDHQLHEINHGRRHEVRSYPITQRHSGTERRNRWVVGVLGVVIIAIAFGLWYLL